MIEPAPIDKKPPKKGEIARVGIVLREDNIDHLYLNSLSGKHLIKTDKEKFVIDSLVEIKTKGSNFVVFTGGKEIISNSLSIEYEGEDSVFELSPLIVGRSFHWRKKIPLKFYGGLQFYNYQGAIEVVNIVLFEDYIISVAMSEMNALAPKEFLKAQAIAARSWAWVFFNKKHPARDYDVCNDDDCQRYQGVTFINPDIINIIKETRGCFLVNSKADVLPAYYSKCCGGCTETTKDIFGFEYSDIVNIFDSKQNINKEPKRGVNAWITDIRECFYCFQTDNNKDLLKNSLGGVDTVESYFRWIKTIPASLILKNIALHKCIELRSLVDIKANKRSFGGRITNMQLSCRGSSKRLTDIYLNNQYEIRQIFSERFLLSSCFIFTVDKKGGDINTVILKGGGWGHGVGLCQMGGVAMAINGFNYKEILKHYYPKSNLHRVV